MAEKKPQDDKERFEAEVYRLGLELIEDFRTGRYPDRDRALEVIIAIFNRDNATSVA